MLFIFLNCCPYVGPAYSMPSCPMPLLKFPVSPAISIRFGTSGSNNLYDILSDNVSGVPKNVLQSIMGAAISSYSKLQCGRNNRFEETSRFLHLARRHKLCIQILSAIADFLDSVYG